MGKNNELINLTLEEHIKLLNQLGYIVEGTKEEIPKYRSVNIRKENSATPRGYIAFEERKLYYLYRDKRIVGNRDLSLINFNNTSIYRSMIHLSLHDFNLKFNGFNQLVSDKRNFICITDNETYKITKTVGKDEIEVKSLIDGVSDDEILDYLRKPSDEYKKLTYSLNEVKKK